VMDKGRIVERGTHAELLRANGLFAQMWALQQRAAAQPEPVDTVGAADGGR
jgi:ABC-type transport system involved in cytochrome bd biosynthesis fused ATPase/permease subunit